ncbi:MAG TPA: hypothetical protein VF538_10000 [Pyrinomonadaceae bacterium]|jgi:hypothetical protein
MKEDCDCCQPEAELTPLSVENRPGLSMVAYRIGTYASFRETMLQTIARTPELASLTTRRSDDYSITLLELWSAVCDILTFYQERYANESFLRTASSRESVGRLANLIGYSLRPGVAALARVALTVESGQTVSVPKGLRVQSVPGQDELPQTFETIETLTADARLNSLRVFPQPSSSVGPLAAGQATATLERRTQDPALAAALAPGQHVVLFNDRTSAVQEEKEVDTVITQDDRAVLTWKTPVKSGAWTSSTKAFKFGRTFRLFGHNAPANVLTPESIGGDPTRIRWNFATLTSYAYPSASAEETNSGGASRLCLDGRHEGLSVGQKLLVADGAGNRSLVTITQIDQAQDTLGALTDTVTRLWVVPDTTPATAITPLSDRRKVVVYELTSPVITFWPSRYGNTITGSAVYLPGKSFTDEKGAGVEVNRTIERNAFKAGVRLHPSDIAKGREVMLTDASGAVVTATVLDTPTITPPDANGFCHLVIQLDTDEPLGLDTSTAILLGNVLLASHGETVRNEIIGNGDAAAKYQRFSLKKRPLTYVPGATSGGTQSSLQVLVGGVRWQEVASLYGQPSDATVYSTRQADDGTTVVQFGDGASGAVLPTGAGNVVATYRVGSGLVGRVGGAKLTTMLDRVKGLSAATNPLPAEGGADPEAIEDARRNAPRTVRTFGRAVSLRDFEDLVTASGEVAKAQATWVWDGLAQAIHLTVAAQAGAVFGDSALRLLGDGLTASRDPNHRLILANYKSVPVRLQATVNVDPNYVRKDVLAAARAAVLDELSFDTRRLGQPVHLSDVFRVLQENDGVVFVDIDVLMFKRPAGMTSDAAYHTYLADRGVEFLPGGVARPVQPHLRIFPARPDAASFGKILPAELAFVESAAQDVLVTATGGLES